MANGHDIKGLEKRISALSAALANLNNADDFKKLILLLRKPGWTTPAEFLFAVGIVDSMTAHVNALIQMKTVLVKGSAAVTGTGK